MIYTFLKKDLKRFCFKVTLVVFIVSNVSGLNAA